MAPNSTSAYADAPSSGSGRGVLVLHSWWGLTDGIRDLCNQLADAGYCALAPDLFGGKVAVDDGDGQRLLMEADPNDLVLGVMSCADALKNMPATTDEPLAVIGFSMGASLGLWLSEREAQLVSTVVSFYGSQNIDFTETRSRYQFHMAADDPMLDHDEFALMEASLGLADRPVEVHTYDGVAHNFAETGTAGYDSVEAASAWARTLAFLDDG